VKKTFFLGFARNTVTMLASVAFVSSTLGQIPTTAGRGNMPTNGGASLPASNAVIDARLQIYDLPTDAIGTVAAQLQLQYASDKRIRVTTEPGTGRLMVLAPEAQQQAIGQFVANVRANHPSSRPNAPVVIQQTNYKLQKVSSKQFEEAIGRLAGNRMTTVELGNGVVSLRMVTQSGPQELMQIERPSGTVRLSGTPSSVLAWNQVIAAIDLGQSDPNRPTQIVPMNPATPERIERAVKLVRFASYQQQGNNPQEDETGVAQLGQGRPGDQAMAIGTPEGIAGTGLIGEVDISFVNEMGLVIVKGAKKDVERVLEVIDKIKKQSAETQPDIELKMLKHVNSQALEVIIRQINTDVFQPRQGSVNITALGQPNALLLIGRKEAMKSLIDLIDKLDTPLDPNSQLRVFNLLHTSSLDAVTLVQNFFSDGATTGAGAGTTDRVGLNTRVKVVADGRTNSLIVQASPRDLAEVANLIQQIDVESTSAESQIKIFPIKNAVASELQTILANAIGGQSIGGAATQGQGQQGNQQGGGQGATGAPRTPSAKLTVAPRDENGKTVDSGILSGVVVTNSPSINALVVRAPAKSMPLIGALIEQLDQLPNTEARIKVFPVINGDATSLTTTLQQIFGIQPTTATGAGAQNAVTLGLLGLANLTTGGENSLVPLRLSTDNRTNSIIASGSASDLEVIEAVLYRLDDKAGSQRSNEVVWLRNTTSDFVTTALTQLLNTQRQFLQQQRQATNGQGGALISVVEQFDREVFIASEPSTNSILISATPRYMDQIRQVVTQLDRQLPMIAVEMLVAEVTLDDNFEMGTEFGLQDSLLFDRGSASRGTLGGGSTPSPAFNIATPPPGNAVTAGRPQNLAGQGITGFNMGRANSQLGYGGLVLAAGSESVNILFRALQDANRLQILSRPNLLTIDNNVSVVSIGQSVPRVTSTGATQFGAQNNTVGEANVGLTMQIQPRTNQDGLINMIVAVERSVLGNVDDGVPVGFGPNGEAILSPIINRTLLQTRVTAYDAQTVVLGGLIQKTRSTRARRVPWLSDIPVAGMLFRFDSEAESRSELIVIMTPRLINPNDAAKLDLIKQVESSRMSWCMADILNIHGDVGLSPGNGLWGPAASPVIFPDMQPTAEFDPNQNPNLLMGEPEVMPSSIQEVPVMSEPGAGRTLLRNSPEGSNIGPAVNTATPIQNSSYQLPPANGQQMTNGVSQASYQPVGPNARVANQGSR
jgi:type II secretory pathway component GspD/PulD (secretin)